MKLNDFDYLAQLPGEEREQSWIRMRLETLSVREGIILAAAAQADPPENAAQAINQLQSLDEYTVRVDVGSYEALGRWYLLKKTEMPRDALPFIDLDEMGRQYEDKHPGLFIGNCYVQYPETPPSPVYQPGAGLPADDGWSVKVKLASPAVPEGVWLRLPGPFFEDCCNEETIEEVLALQELCIQRWEDCSLVDVHCILPEAGDLMVQYSDIDDLLYDSVSMGCFLREKGQGSPHFMERYTAALALEGCQNLKLALDISQNLRCYDWEQRTDLEASAEGLLLDKGVPEELIRASGIDLAGYKAHLLEKEGYTPAPGGGGYIRRNNQEFYYQYSTPVQPQEEPGMAVQ